MEKPKSHVELITKYGILGLIAQWFLWFPDLIHEPSAHHSTLIWAYYLVLGLLFTLYLLERKRNGK